MRANESDRNRSSARLRCRAVALAAFGLLAVRAPAQVTETVLHNFPGPPPMGASPGSGVVRDSAGNFYGTTSFGGAANAGVVYQIDPAGTETVLYSFTGGADGGRPSSGVILDPAGNLYGTTVEGGAGYGVVYKVSGRGHETVPYAFKNEGYGAGPQGVVRDGGGNLYGTTIGGVDGAGPGCINRVCSIVHKLDPAGNETVLYSAPLLPMATSPRGEAPSVRPLKLYKISYLAFCAVPLVVNNVTTTNVAAKVIVRL